MGEESREKEKKKKVSGGGCEDKRLVKRREKTRDVGWLKRRKEIGRKRVEGRESKSVDERKENR